MIEKNIQIKNKCGLHVRPAAQFIKLTSKFTSKVYLEKEGEKANGKSILEVLSLGAEENSLVKIIIDGKDEKEALRAIEDFFSPDGVEQKCD